ncbi:unnamed protein product [Trichogramma brassicae]|uniref:Uncharacterized protein n=1 Tax=Trichogramma brassicae TaxID=86971 RepID=A0A6H5HUH3_9HYME|nr:unnamed protein product [Trichogramma brassicae]
MVVPSSSMLAFRRRHSQQPQAVATTRPTSTAILGDQMPATAGGRRSRRGASPDAEAYQTRAFLENSFSSSTSISLELCKCTTRSIDAYDDASRTSHGGGGGGGAPSTTTPARVGARIVVILPLACVMAYCLLLHGEARGASSDFSAARLTPVLFSACAIGSCATFSANACSMSYTYIY